MEIRKKLIVMNQPEREQVVWEEWSSQPEVLTDSSVNPEVWFTEYCDSLEDCLFRLEDGIPTYYVPRRDSIVGLGLFDDEGYLIKQRQIYY